MNFLKKFWHWILGAVFGLAVVYAAVANPTPEQLTCIADTTKKVSERIDCPVADKASFKGQEIAKIGSIAKVRRTDGFDGYIEITDIKEIPNGVEVLARAWDKNNVQIGFGDGSVDIERFVIINPPILVDDPLGDITRTWADVNTGETKTRKLREDLQEAVLQSLAHTIFVKQQKFGSENIVAGRIGNTTLTAYPVAGTGTAPIDGVGGRSTVDEIFSTIRNGAGNYSNDTVAEIFVRISGSGTTDQFQFANRVGAGFTTSSIGTDTVDSATLSLYNSSIATVLGNTDVDLVSFTPANGADFATTDFDGGDLGATRYATGISISGIGAGYNSFTLNTDGKNYINKTGNTFFGVLVKWDTDNSFTGTWSSNGTTGWFFSAADEAGTTQDPKLVVEHSAAATTPKRPAIIQWQ